MMRLGELVFLDWLARELLAYFGGSSISQFSWMVQMERGALRMMRLEIQGTGMKGNGLDWKSLSLVKIITSDLSLRVLMPVEDKDWNVGMVDCEPRPEEDSSAGALTKRGCARPS